MHMQTLAGQSLLYLCLMGMSVAHALGPALAFREIHHKIHPIQAYLCLAGTDVTGAVFYNKTLTPALWGWYNETVNTVLVAGDSDSSLSVQVGSALPMHRIHDVLYTARLPLDSQGLCSSC